MNETRWWWLRHAPIIGPAGGIHGCLDLPCDCSDRDRFRSLADRLPQDALLVQSGLIRCGQTIAGLMQAGLGLPAAAVEPDLKEQDFGLWQGRGWDNLEPDDTLDAFWRDPAGTAPPGGESFAAVMARVRRVIERLDAAYAGRDIIAVAHAGTIRAALAFALDLSPTAALRLVIDPLSLTRIDRIGPGWRISAVNS